MRIYTKIALSLLVTSSVPALPSIANEFLLYPPCQAVVDGTLRAQASVAGNGFGCLDTDTCDYDRTVNLITTGIAFRDSCRVAANVSKSFFDGCQTNASADVEGGAGYTFDADDTKIVFGFDSVNEQTDTVRRGILAIGPGSPVFARSIFDLAGHNQFTLTTPFMVGGGNGASIQAKLGLKRSDSGPSNGQVLGSWIIFSDLNGNCVVDPNEPIVAQDSALIGPNQSFTAPTLTFPTPRGNYILAIGHSFSSDLAADSLNCSQSISANSTIEHSFALSFEIVTSCP